MSETRKSPPRVRPAARQAAGGSGGADEIAFLQCVFAMASLSLNAYREKALLRRLPSCLRHLRVADVAEATDAVKSRPGLVGGVLEVLLLGVTDFCRDLEIFRHLDEAVVPTFRALGRPARVWSAACSDGRELYSFAMLLNHAGILAGAELLGTDCREKAIAAAEFGRYSPSAVAGLGPDWLEHFRFDAHTVWPKEHILAATRWKQADLLASAETGPWDAILWRNMAIYLEPDAADRVWQALAAEIRPGGFLVTGKADNPPAMPGFWRVGPCVYRKEDRR